jgi:hypothetical protein
MPSSPPPKSPHRLAIISFGLAVLSFLAYLIHFVLGRHSTSNQPQQRRPQNILPVVAATGSIIPGLLILYYFITGRRSVRSTVLLPASVNPVSAETAQEIAPTPAPPPITITVPPPAPEPTLTLGAVAKRPVTPVLKIWVRLPAIGLVMLSLLLLAGAQYILNIADWVGAHVSLPEPLQTLACLPPRFCELRFPPDGLIGLAAVVVAMVLFGLVIWWLSPELPITDLKVQAFQLKPVSRWVAPTSLIALCLTIGFGIYVLYKSIAHEPVEVIVWLAQLGAFVWLVWHFKNREDEPANDQRATIVNLVYLAGLASLLFATAAIFAARPSVLIFGVAGAGLLLGWVFFRNWSAWDRAQRFERLALPVLAVLFLCALSYGSRDWHWAVAENAPSAWDYFEEANFYITGAKAWPAVNQPGVYQGTGALSSAAQAASMVVFGADVYGWRVSNYLLLALAVPALYYFTRHYQGRFGGLLTTSLYVGGHYLLSYSKTGFHTVQIIAVFLFTLAALAWATRHGSLAGYALAGIILGAGFYTYGVARIYVWGVLVWLLVYCFPFSWRNRKIDWARVAIWLVLIGGVILTALPITLDPSGWSEQIRRTVFVQSDAGNPQSVWFVQLLYNLLYGFTSFLTSSANTTFVYGAHTDPITATLIVLAVPALLMTWRQSSRVRIFIFGLAGGLTFFISSLHTYVYPSTNWMLALTPLYAIGAGIGAQVLVTLLQQLLSRASPSGPQTGGLGFQGLAVGLVALSLPLNWWISTDLAKRKLTQPPQNFIIQSAQQTSAPDGTGAHIYAIIDTANQFYYLSDNLKPFLPLWFEAYHIPLDRLSALDPAQALGDAALCNTTEPAVMIADVGLANVDAVIDRLIDCWPDAKAAEVEDATGRELFYRLQNPAALALLHPVPGYWIEKDLPRLAPQTVALVEHDNWQIFQPLAIAVSPTGLIAAVEGQTNSILFFDQSGHITKILSGDLVYPSGVGFDSKGQFLVLDAGAPSPLTWYGADYKRIQNAVGLTAPRGMFIAPDNSIYVADTGAQRLVQLDEAGLLRQVFKLPELLGQPTSIAVSPDGLLAVGDPTVGKIYVLNSQGELLNDYSIATGGTTVDKPGLVWLGNDQLLYTDPGANKLILVQGQTVLREWNDLMRPTGLALLDERHAVVLEFARNKISVVEIAK